MFYQVLQCQEKGQCFLTEKAQIQIGHKEDIFDNEGGEALVQGAQRSYGCPIPGSLCWMEQCDLLTDVPASGIGFRLQ